MVYLLIKNIYFELNDLDLLSVDGVKKYQSIIDVFNELYHLIDLIFNM